MNVFSRYRLFNLSGHFFIPLSYNTQDLPKGPRGVGGNVLEGGVSGRGSVKGWGNEWGTQSR